MKSIPKLWQYNRLNTASVLIQPLSMSLSYVLWASLNTASVLIQRIFYLALLKTSPSLNTASVLIQLSHEWCSRLDWTIV